MFCCIKSIADVIFMAKNSLWTKPTSLWAVQVWDVPPFSILLAEGTGKVKAGQKGINTSRI